MRFANRILMVAGTAALAGILALAIAPKAAHALVVTLVQVANTTANPVPTEDIRGTASQILELTCATDTGSGEPCTQDAPGGLSTAQFTVPTGQHFVITQIEAVCSGGGTELLGFSFPASVAGDTVFFASRTYEFPCNSTTVEFNLQPGLVLPSSQVPTFFSRSKATDQPTYVRGYLTAN